MTDKLKWRPLSLIILVVVILSAILGGHAVEAVSNPGCDFPSPTTCTLSPFKNWKNLNPGQVYTFSFALEQTISVQTTERDENKGQRSLQNNQTAITSGTLELVRGSGNSCTASFTLVDATVSYAQIQNSDTTDEDTFVVETPFILEGPNIFALFDFDFGEFEDYPKEPQRFCAPEGEDVWKSNIRRSLISMIKANLASSRNLTGAALNTDNELFGVWYNEDETDSLKMEERAGLDIVWGTGSKSSRRPWLVKLRPTSHNQDADKMLAFKALAHKYEKDYNNETLLKELSSRDDYGEELFKKWMESLGSYTNFKLSGSKSFLRTGEVEGFLESVSFREVQRVSTGFHLTTEIVSKGEMRLLSPDSPKAVELNEDGNWNPGNQPMTKISINFDPSFHTLSNDTKMCQAFEKLVSTMNGNLESPEAFLEFAEKMKRILPFVPVHVLREQLTVLQTKDTFLADRFLNVVASLASDNMVKFMVPLITNAHPGMTAEVFSTFLWTATLMPTTENDNFQRYASSKTFTQLRKLLNSTELYHRKYDMSDSDFLLHMASLLNKEEAMDDWDLDDILLKVEYILDLGKLVTSLENNGTQIDRGTHLAVRRAMEKYGQQLDPDDDSELDDDFARLATHNPCSKKHLRYLQQLLESDGKDVDLKIMAYLFMRKCYIPEWQGLVEKHYRAYPENKDVVLFMLLHIKAMESSRKAVSAENDKIVPIMAMRVGQYRSKFGTTFYMPLDSELSPFSQFGGPKSKTEFELNFVKGAGLLPRFLGMQLRTYENNGELDSVEIEILRLDGRNPEFILTISENGVTLYTETLELDQSELLKLFQNGENPTLTALTGFFKSLFSMNRASFSKLLKNRKLEWRRINLEAGRRSVPSLTGLPIHINTQWNRLYSYNFTQHFAPKSYSIRFNPSVTLQEKETISLGLEQSEILGYQLTSMFSLNLNLEFSISQDNDGSYKAWIGLGRDNSNQTTFHFLNMDALKLQLFQVGDLSDVRESSPIFLQRNPLRPIVPWGPGGSCGFRHPEARWYNSAFYRTGSIFCNIPSRIVVEVDAQLQSSLPSRHLNGRIYPESGSVSNMTQEDREVLFLFEFNRTENTSEVENFQAYFNIPTSTRQEFNVVAVLKSDDPLKKSLKVYYTGVGGKSGFELHQELINREYLERGLEISTPFGSLALLVKDLDGKPDLHGSFVLKQLHPLVNGVLTFSYDNEHLEGDNLTVAISGVNHKVERITKTLGEYRLENLFFGNVTGQYSQTNYTSPIPNEKEKWEAALLLRYGPWDQETERQKEYARWIYGYREIQSPDLKTLSKWHVNILTVTQYPEVDFSSTLSITTDSNKSDNCPNPGLVSVHGMMKNMPDHTSHLILTYDTDTAKNTSFTEEDCKCRRDLTKIDVSLPGFGYFRRNVHKDHGKVVELGIHLEWLLGRKTSTNIVYQEMKKDLGNQLTFLAQVTGPKNVNLFSTDHKLTPISTSMTSYNGSITSLDAGKKLKWSGLLKNELGAQFSYTSMVNVTDLVENGSNRSYKLSLTDIPQNSSTHYYKLLLVEDDSSNREVVNASLDLFKETSPEGYGLSAKGVVTDLYDAQLNVGRRNAAFVVILHKTGVKMNTKLSLVEGESKAFKVDGYVRNLTSGLDLWAIYSESSFKFLNATETMKYFFQQASETETPTDGIQDCLLTSRSTLNSPWGKNTLNILYQDHPHEEADRPILVISINEDSSQESGNDSSEDSKNQYSLRLNAQLNRTKNADGNLSYIIGHWLRLSRPSVTPFTLSCVLNYDQHRLWTSPGSIQPHYMSNHSLRHELKMDHRGFFSPKVDTKIQIGGHLSHQITSEWDDSGQDALTPVLTTRREKVAEAELTFKADGVQSWPETQLGANVIAESSYKGSGGVQILLHKGVKGARHHNLRLGTSLRFDPYLHQKHGNITSELGWSWEERVEESRGQNEKFISAGNHVLNVLHESVTNFEVTVNHNLSTFLGEHVWEDKAVVKHTHHPSRCICSLNSPLISATVTHEEILANASLSEEGDDSFYNRSKTGLVLTSDTFPKINGIILELELGSLVDPLNESTYATDIYLDLSPMSLKVGKRNLSSIYKIRKDYSYVDREQVELVTHKLRQIQDMKSDHSHHQRKWDWASALAMVHDSDQVPTFLHYDYSAENVLQNMETEAEVVDYFTSGVISTSALAHGQIFFRFQKDRKIPSGGSIGYENKEILLRIGQPSAEVSTVSGDGFSCESSQSRLSSMIDRFVSDWMDDVSGYYLIEQGCDGLGERKLRDWDPNNKGTFLWHGYRSWNKTEARSVNPKNLTESIRWSDITLATWSKEGNCSAETRIDGRLDDGWTDITNLDKFCTTTLAELGESGSCLAGVENGEGSCNGSMLIKFWTIPMARLDSVTVHAITDSIVFPYIFGKWTFF